MKTARTRPPKAQRALLERIERLDGRLQLLQVTASGGRPTALNELRQAGLVIVCDHPTVKDVDGYPAQALQITDVGRKQLLLWQMTPSTWETLRESAQDGSGNHAWNTKKGALASLGLIDGHKVTDAGRALIEAHPSEPAP